MKPLSVSIIVGSVRENNNSLKIAKVLSRYLRDKGLNTFIVNPANFMLPFPGEKLQGSDTSYLQELVKNADGAIFVTPEYNGSLSSVLKLVIENLGYPSVLKLKPTCIVGVTAGKFGAIRPMEHLRGILAHCGAYVYPQQVAISRVYEMIDVQGHIKDDDTRNRLKDMTNGYAEFLQKFSSRKPFVDNFDIRNSVMN